MSLPERGVKLFDPTLTKIGDTCRRPMSLTDGDALFVWEEPVRLIRMDGPHPTYAGGEIGEAGPLTQQWWYETLSKAPVETFFTEEPLPPWNVSRIADAHGPRGDELVRQWVNERRLNCLRLASERDGLDRRMWLDDAGYFGDILRLLHARDQQIVEARRAERERCAQRASAAGREVEVSNRLGTKVTSDEVRELTKFCAGVGDAIAAAIRSLSEDADGQS